MLRPSNKEKLTVTPRYPLVPIGPASIVIRLYKV